ncbi:hypothetical protein M3Y97_00778500 [Aphelenchoides bicaudatus]|nr:hypothetical protein M3Y97_00778500 [Aphelenchoides bicaudatus]
MVLIRVKRKRSLIPQNALLVTGDFQPEAQEDENAAGPSNKRARQQDDAQKQPSAFRLIGTLPMPDVRDAARLFLPDENAQVVKYVEVDNLENGNQAPIISLQMNNVQDILMDNMAKLNSVNLAAEKASDPFLAVVDDAPLARPESGLDGDLDDFVYDYYHAGTSFINQEFSRVNVRLPTNEELQMYFGGEEMSDGEEDTNDGDSDSNAENYYRNEYPDEGEFEGALENETTSSDDSYDHYGDEPKDFHNYLSDEDSV